MFAERAEAEVARLTDTVLPPQKSARVAKPRPMWQKILREKSKEIQKHQLLAEEADGWRWLAERVLEIHRLLAGVHT